MFDSQQQDLDLNAINLYEDDASNEGMRAIRYLTSRLQEAQSNPNLRAIVHAQMHARALFPDVQEERARSLEQRESPRREDSKEGQKSSPRRRRRSDAMGIPRPHARERQRDDANDANATRDRESNSDSCGHFDEDIFPQDNAIHNALLFVLQSKGAVVQPTALLTQVKEALTRGTLDKEEGDLQLLHLLCLILQVQMLVHQKLSPKEGGIDVHIQPGSGHATWKSSKKEGKMLLSFLMMGLMELRIESLDLSNSLI